MTRPVSTAYGATHRPPGFAVRLTHVAVIALLAAAGVLASPGAASAHVTLVSVTPEQGATLDDAPERVVFTLDESVQLVEDTGRVIDGAGEQFQTAVLTQRGGREVVIELESNIPDGAFLATVRVLSADSHVVALSTQFRVGSATGAAPVAETATSGGGWGTLQSAARGVGYLATAASLGLMAVTAWLWPGAIGAPRRRLRHIAAGAGGVLAAGAFVDLVAQTINASGSPSSVWDNGVMLQIVMSLFGVATLVRVAAGLVVVGFIVARARGDRAIGRPEVIVGSVGAVVVAVAFAVSGHAAAGDDVVVAVLASTLHVLAMTVWVGGLVALVAVVRDIHVRTWSRVALGCVVVLVLTGAYQTVRSVRPLQALWTTDYGQLLLAKLVFVAVLLALAWVTNRRFSQAARDASQGPRVRKAVAQELVLVTAVLSATAVLSFQPPAYATYGPPASVSADFTAGASVRVDVDSTRRGPQRIELTLSDPVSRVTEMNGVMSSADAGVARLPVAFHNDGEGRWRSEGLVVPLAGEWMLTLTGSGEDLIVEPVTAVRFTVW